MRLECWVTVSLGVLIAGCELVAELDGFEDQASASGGTGGVAAPGGGGTSTSAGGSPSFGGGGSGGAGAGGAAGGAGEAGSGGAPPPCDEGFDFSPVPTSGRLFIASYSNTTAFTYVDLVVDPVPDMLEGRGDVTGQYTWSWEVVVNEASPTLYTFTFTHQEPPVRVASCQVWIGP